MMYTPPYVIVSKDPTEAGLRVVLEIFAAI